MKIPMVLVTGGYSGIGVETVRAFRSAGATVVVPARDIAKAKANLADMPEVCLHITDLLDRLPSGSDSQSCTSLINWPIWPIATAANVYSFKGLSLASRLHSQSRGSSMLRIERSENAEVAFTLSGQMDSGAIAELERLIDSEATGRGVVLNLRNLTFVDEVGVIFLERCESKSVKLQNCPPYVREWINRQRQGS